MKIREETCRKLKEKFEINEELTIALFDNGLIDEGNARNFLIQEEYRDRIDDLPKIDTRLILADKYAVSYSTVEKITLKNSAEKKSENFVNL